jgi:hypothetical protein
MKLRILLFATLTLALLAPVGPVEAQQRTTCEARSDFDFKPGFWREGNSGTFTTNGETGTVTCNGPVNGKMPTGPGSYGAYGDYGTKDPDNCSNAEGIYHNSITIPTADGPQRVTNKGEWVVGVFRGGGAFGGEFTGETADGTFEGTAKEGDCVTRPMTKMDVTLRWTLKR